MDSYERKALTGAQLRAARGLLNISALELATATQLGVATIRRAEAADGPVNMTGANAARIVDFLEMQGVQLVDSGDGGRGVRFANPDK